MLLHLQQETNVEDSREPIILCSMEIQVLFNPEQRRVGQRSFLEPVIICSSTNKNITRSQSNINVEKAVTDCQTLNPSRQPAKPVGGDSSCPNNVLRHNHIINLPDQLPFFPRINELMQFLLVSKQRQCCIRLVFWQGAIAGTSNKQRRPGIVVVGLRHFSVTRMSNY